MTRSWRRRAVALAMTALVTSCSGSTALPSEVTAPEPEPTTTVAPVPVRECTPQERAAPTATYPPSQPLPSPDALPPRSRMAEIRASGQLVVGVSADTLLFGSRNPLTTDIEGFDVDMLKEVAKAIFGDDGADRILYRVITYADRLPKLESGEVDIVAHTMTINCARWQRIAFSSVYFMAGQSVLVKKGFGFGSVDDLVAAQATVCAPEGSTNIDEISSAKYAGIVVLGKPDISDCLVAMQQGEADATTGDDTVLAGFAAQDPNTEVVDQPPFTQEPYGLGFNKDDVGFVQFVNALLEEMRTDGRLDAIVQRWLIDTGALKTIAPVPPPDYSRPLT